MKLYLMRHGEAAAGILDAKRSLTPKGKKEVEKVARFLKRSGVNVKDFYHSSKRRAQQTAEIVRDTLNPNGKLVEKKYLAPEDSTEQIAEELFRRQEDLMIVGHMPHLPRLISRLVLGVEGEYMLNFSTGSVAAMYRDSRNNWQIVWLVGPNLIKDK